MNNQSVKTALNTEKQAALRSLIAILGVTRTASLAGVSNHGVLAACAGKRLRETARTQLERAIDALSPIADFARSFAESRDVAA